MSNNQNEGRGFPTRNVMTEDFGWEVPHETVPIPSEGKVYLGDTNLQGMSMIDIRAMTAHEEDILTSRALIKRGTVITKLLESCITDKNIDVRDMLSGDRNAIMVAVRITGYGTEYKAEVTCPKCTERSSQEFDLGNLGIKRLHIDPVAPGQNRFSYTLPVTKKDVHFRFLTGKDEESMSTEATKMQQLFPDREEDNLVTTRLTNCIISIDGIEDRNKLNTFVRNMPALDSRRLRTYMDTNEPGIDMSSDMLCPHCGAASMIDLPMGAGFFWPRD